MKRKLSAILAADVAGYSKMMAEDEAGTLTTLNLHRREIFDPEVARHGGRIIKLMVDGTLVEFPSIVDAVDAAVAIQRAADAGKTALRLRIGINLGDVILDGDDIYGDGVNIAARLEGLAAPGGICISSIVHESLGNRTEAQFVDAEEYQVKNIARPIRVFRWPADGSHCPAMSGGAPQDSSRLSLSVSEFVPLSDEMRLAHFASGLGHALVTELGRFSVLAVTYLPQAGRSGTPPARTRYVLDGSLQASGNRMRVSAQLRDADSGEQVWASHVDADAGDLLGFQDEAARRISGNLHQPMMNHAIARARALPLEKAQPYDHYLRSFHHIERPTSAGMAAAFEACQRAREADPAFALVYEHLAWINIHSALNAWADDPEAALQAAAREAARGIQYDSKEPYLRSALGLSLALAGQAEQGLRETELAVRLAPADGEQVVFHAAALSLAGRTDAALKTFDEAEILSPGYPPITLFRGDALLADGHADQAAGCFGEAVLALPEYSWAWANLAVCCHETNDTRRAVQAIATIRRQSPKMTVSYMEALMSCRAPDFVERVVAALRHHGLGRCAERRCAPEMRGPRPGRAQPGAPGAFLFERPRG